MPLLSGETGDEPDEVHRAICRARVRRPVRPAEDGSYWLTETVVDRTVEVAVRRDDPGDCRL